MKPMMLYGSLDGAPLNWYVTRRFRKPDVGHRLSIQPFQIWLRKGNIDVVVDSITVIEGTLVQYAFRSVKK